MTTQIRTATRGARSLRTLAFDDTQGDSLAWELAQSGHACRVLSTTLKDALPIRLTSSNVRVSQTQIVILAKTPTQRSRLKQLLPRLEEALRKVGFNQSLDIRVHSNENRIEPRSPSDGVPRHGNPQAAAAMLQEAKSVDDPTLREALFRLADALSSTN